MDHPRKLWQSSLLHFVLVFGSLVFALPYFWLMGTSFKLDKEVQTDEITIFPQRPIPRPVSPYVDERHFKPPAKPEAAPSGPWDEWMRQAIVEELGAFIRIWLAAGDDQRVAGLDLGGLEEELVEGVFARVRNLLPLDVWREDQGAFRAALRSVLRTDYVEEALAQSYRYFALGKVLVKNRDYRVADLTGDTPVDRLWRVEHGPARLVESTEAGRPVGVVHYDFTEAEEFEVSAMLDLPTVDGGSRPFDFEEDFKRLSLSFRRDQTWHELRVAIEVQGILLEATAPKYLSEDTWWDVIYQEPSSDDLRATRLYILLERTGSGVQYHHGPGKLKLRVRLSRSSTPEAYWAKSTENYRKAFEQVPFARYLKTSIFLVIANIVGTALSCSLVAFAFARLNWPGRDFCFMLVLATLMIPPQITMIPSFVIYKHLGWYNTLAPLWVPNLLAVNAFAVFLLRQAMKGIPRDLEEAAQIDGCGWLRIYWNVALPLMRPTIAAISIFTFMFVWNDFMTPLIYVNDQRLYPLALGLFSFLAGRENQFTLIMAGSMIMTIPVILTFFFAQRHFIQGVTMTGMKN